jgi:hypothetical protein
VKRLQGTVYADGVGRVSVLHNDHAVCEILIPTTNDRPTLFGLGSVGWPLSGGAIPAQQGFGADAKEAFSSHLTSVIGAFGKEGEGWKITDSSARRFRLPDSLRAVFHAMGAGVARAFLDGANTRWLYSEEAHNCGLNPLPHESLTSLGRTTNPDGEVFVAPAGDDRLAYYIERWQGHELGELKELGQALWTVFSAQRHGTAPEGVAALLLENKRGRIGVRPQAKLAAPQRVPDGLTWSAFLFWLDDQPDELFRQAGRAYASHCEHEFPVWPKVRRTEVDYLDIHGRTWKVAHA